MAARIPAHIREQQINALPDITFVHWLDGYTSNKSYAAVKCTVDGNLWNAAVTNLLSGYGCPECGKLSSIDKKRKPRDLVEQQINTLPNIRFVRWLDGYTNAHSKAVCRCDICDDFEWPSTVDNLLRGSGCPECAGSGYSQAKRGTLYALLSECRRHVKIGISNDYKRRLRDLTSRTPFAFDCVELIHGDGALIASLEKAFHGMTESVTFSEPFDGHTEWRKWTPELTGWFNTWREMT